MTAVGCCDCCVRALHAHTVKAFRFAVNTMPPPTYFESQVDHNCAIHAVNNALQRALLNPTLMKRTARELAAQLAARARRNQRQSRRTVESTRALVVRVLPSLMGPLGDYSPDVAFTALRAKGWHTIHGRTTAFPQSGPWLVTREVSYEDPHAPGVQLGTYAHSVAVRDGWWLDSELDGPLRLRVGDPLPAYFRVWAVYRLTRDPPPPAADDGAAIDLTHA